uniref:Uncharacterized protein n=1 Tax=Syphacia muris TaxID=451379 RepID=A0A0N5AMA6_9BILA
MDEIVILENQQQSRRNRNSWKKNLDDFKSCTELKMKNQQGINKQKGPDVLCDDEEISQIREKLLEAKQKSAKIEGTQICLLQRASNDRAPGAKKSCVGLCPSGSGARKQESEPWRQQ